MPSNWKTVLPPGSVVLLETPVRSSQALPLAKHLAHLSQRVEHEYLPLCRVSVLHQCSQRNLFCHQHWQMSVSQWIFQRALVHPMNHLLMQLLQHLPEPPLELKLTLDWAKQKLARAELTELAEPCLEFFGEFPYIFGASNDQGVCLLLVQLYHTLQGLLLRLCHRGSSSAQVLNLKKQNQKESNYWMYIHPSPMSCVRWRSDVQVKSWFYLNPSVFERFPKLSNSAFPWTWNSCANWTTSRGDASPYANFSTTPPIFTLHVFLLTLTVGKAAFACEATKKNK